MPIKRRNNVFILLTVSLFVFIALIASITPESFKVEAEKAGLTGGASKVADKEASGRYLASLAKTGATVKFNKLPASGRLAIRYASVMAGTISVSVNDLPAIKVNIHSSGALTGSFLNAIIDIPIPSGSVLTIKLDSGDASMNIDYIVVGNDDLGLPQDIWNLPPLPITEGPFPPDWNDISRIYVTPEWWRDAKFGAWSHWDPQSMPEQGDWYARGMYIQGNRQYEFHLTHFGHPSEYGYKDICHNWVIDKWDPEMLLSLYTEMGAKYFMAMGVHHDNFDCWNSSFQPWNSVNVGPKMDIVGKWESTARKYGMRFGIGFHHSPPRTWGQFMPVRYTSDKTGPMKGIPYDALQTILDGKGKWWEGMDPVDLYGPVHTKENPLLSPFSNQFMWRVDDAITKYHPDVIYFDEAAGDSLIDLGVSMGLGFLAPRLVANYYNKSMQWNKGKMDVVINLKCVGGKYDSFKKNPELIPIVERALVKSSEAIIEPKIMAYSFQTETSSGVWHFQTGQSYLDATTVIRLLMENVSRNGSLLLNISHHGRGDLDPEVINICKDIGAWLKINGDAVYSSRPFEVSEEKEGQVYYTRNNGFIYATLLKWNGEPIVLKALRSGGNTLGKISKVEIIGSDVPASFVQNDQGLTVTTNEPIQPLPAITDQSLANSCRVIRITHDKDWYNDDDPGVTYPGWIRTCNLNTGDYNNDLTMSKTPGETWNSSFKGTCVKIIAPREKGAGRIDILIDGKIVGTADLFTGGPRLVQQVVCEINGLASGKHSISLINRGPGPVAIDALVVD
jgi:alpha-L-fucosidase